MEYRMNMAKSAALLLFCGVAVVRPAMVTQVLPHVPDVLHPATPTGIDETAQSSDDPEQRPGLYQGDIAIDRFSHGLWKVGLR